MDRGDWQAAVHGVTWLSMCVTCSHDVLHDEGGGRWVSSNKVVELKNKQKTNKIQNIRNAQKSKISVVYLAAKVNQTGYMPICSVFTPLDVHIRHFAEILTYLIVWCWPPGCYIIGGIPLTPSTLEPSSLTTSALSVPTPAVLPRSSKHHHPSPQENIA